MRGAKALKMDFRTTWRPGREHSYNNCFWVVKLHHLESEISNGIKQHQILHFLVLLHAEITFIMK